LGITSTLIQPGGKYFFTKNRSTLVAFTVGQKVTPGNVPGFKIIGAHTDSPNLKIKARSKRNPVTAGCIQIAVECYGGGLWHTWFDRDLSISGRVLVRDVQSTTGEEKIVQKLVNIQKPVARVSSLCIHLQTADERDAFRVNKEDHLVPIIGITDAVKGQLVGGMDFGDDPWKKDQEPLLIQLIADNIGVAAKDIADFELNLYDSQPATIGGCNSEFLYSARVDNLATCFVAVETLVDYTNSESFQNDVDISMICLFDHEEVGSGKCTDRLAFRLLP
jgi:aspartyl aminopeptidase